MTRPTTTGKAQDLITFTRSTTGTYFDSVIYGDELVTNGTFATDFTGWTDVSTGTGSIAVVLGQAQLTRVNLNNRGFISQGITVVAGATYKVQITEVSGQAYVGVGTTETDTTFLGEPLATGENTFYITPNATSVYINVRGIVDGVQLIDNVSVKEVTGGQGTQGTPLLRTSAIDEARIEYDASGNCLGLLVEEARTNLFQYSNQANQLTYHADGATTGVDTTEVTSPEGSGTVIKLNKTSTGYGFARVVHGSITSAQTLSAFVKKGTARYLGFRQLAAVATHTTFDLETNTWVQTAGSTSRGYEDYGNGWLRLWVVSDDSNSKIWTSLCITNSGGTEISSETGTVYVYGIQRELGAFPTSYIPTSGSTATRAVDVASLAVSEFGYNQDQGSVVIGLKNNRGVAGALGDGTFNNDLRFGVVGSNIGRGTGSGFAKSVTTGVFSGQSKIAIGIQEDNYSSAGDGADAGVNDTSASLPPNPVNIYIGKDYGNYLNGHIKSVQYYPLRLSNAQLQALTV